jgi:hypothetical protein
MVEFSDYLVKNRLQQFVSNFKEIKTHVNIYMSFNLISDCFRSLNKLSLFLRCFLHYFYLFPIE